MREASGDLAEVLRRIREAVTVSYDQVLRVPGEPDMEVRVLMARSGRTRVTGPGEKITVIDRAQGRCLVLRPQDRTARFAPMPAAGTGTIEPLEDLRRSSASAGRPVGTEVVAGRKAVLYQIAGPEGEMKVLVDAREELPVRIEAKSRLRDGREIATVLGNFSWNEPIPDALFALEVPPGYDIQAGPSEGALIELLRTCAELNGGYFPDELDMRAVVALVLKAFPEDIDRMPTGEAGTSNDVRGQARATLRHRCVPGLEFVAQVEARGGWRYAGRGVRSGDKGAPVCWWRDSVSTALRIVYGDLRIEDTTQERLRALKAQPTGDEPTSD